MLTLNEAIETLMKHSPNNGKVFMYTTHNGKYLFERSNGEEGCDTVDMKTGEIGFMWIWDVLVLKPKWTYL